MEEPTLDVRHGGDRLAETLLARGVRRLYTLCGGHISPILTASKARGIRVIDVRDEASAVFAADAEGRLTGIPGVAAVTAGPGLTNAITAMQNARLAHSPLVLLCGGVPTALRGRGALQDIDQRAAIAPHVKRAMQVRHVADLQPALEAAFMTASSGVPGPVFLEAPVDLLYDEATIRGWYADATSKGSSLPERAQRWYLQRHVERLFAGSQQTHVAESSLPNLPRASNASLHAAIAALRRAERPLAIVGSQALSVPENAQNIVDAIGSLGIPVYLSGMARGLLGREHPLQMRHRRRDALRESDCVLLAGVPCDFRLAYGGDIRRRSTTIAANRSRADATLNRKPTVAAIGDAGAFLVNLSTEGAWNGAPHADWIARLRERDAEREREISATAMQRGEYVNPVSLLQAIDRFADERAIFVADGGDFVATASYVLRPRAPLSWLDPGVFGTLGVGAGFALASALARPQNEIWALFGDGALGYALAEFDTFVRHRIGLIAVVGNDACWSQIAREQVKMLGDDVGTLLARTAYHEVAAGFGALGILVRTESEIEPALVRAREAARSGVPVLVNVWLERSDFREGSISM
uniref:Thiamine pyrophosphate enzyme-like TPP binding protein n=1 Tax=mine drainage metagenome TaxID=410659 RepID=E6Q0W0_9ZZZZ